MPATVIQFAPKSSRTLSGLTETDLSAALVFAYRAGAIAERCLSDDGAVSLALDGHPRVSLLTRCAGTYAALSDTGEPVAEADSLEALVAGL